MIAFKEMARRHWAKYLPEKTEGLKGAGLLESALDRVAEMATRELQALVRNGAQLEAAKEIVLKEYILLPPETSRK